MYFNKFFKLYYLLFLFIFFHCNSSQNQSFIQLESALINWYYKYNPTLASENNILTYNFHLEQYDIDSIEEYRSDINRFIIELNQIDETKLKNEFLIKYLIIEEFLFDINNNEKNINYYSWNPSYSIYKIYNSLFFILYNNNIDMDKKVDFIISRLDLALDEIINIQNNLIYYSHPDIEEAIKIIAKFEKLLNDLPLSLNSDNRTLDTIDIKIKKIKENLNKLKLYFHNSLDKVNKVDKHIIVNDYLFYNGNSLFQLDYDYLTQEIKNNMINIALPIYLKNNDEPVWVDNEDTLKIINYVLEELTKTYPNKNEILMTLDGSLNRIRSFVDNNLNFLNIDYDSEIIVSDNIYLNRKQLYRIFKDDFKVSLFLDNNNYYDYNNLLNRFNKYEIDSYNIRNYFPGEYHQISYSNDRTSSINNLIINNYTNHGWGLLSEYLLLDKGYGDDENNIYFLIHWKNVFNALLKNIIFVDYYINNKSTDKIFNKISNLTLYNDEKIQEILLEVINFPLDSNFEIIGFLKLKEMYKKFIIKNSFKIDEFYFIMLENADMSPVLIKKFKLNKYE